MLILVIIKMFNKSKCHFEYDLKLITFYLVLSELFTRSSKQGSISCESLVILKILSLTGKLKGKQTKKSPVKEMLNLGDNVSVSKSTIDIFQVP